MKANKILNKTSLITLGLLIGLVFLATPITALADDCTRDPLNAADCMRTPGFRPTISVGISLAGALATVLVNILGGAIQAGGAAAAAPPLSPPSITPTAPPAVPEAKPPAQPGEAPPEPPAQTSSSAGSQPPPDTSGPGALQPGGSWMDFIGQKTGLVSSIIGAVDEYDLFNQVKNLKSALDAWRNLPSKEVGEKLVNAASRVVKIKNAASKLTNITRVIDVVDAVQKGLKTAEDRGYTGLDKGLAVTAEGLKKGLNWMLTSNPAVGLADAIISNVSTHVSGGKVNISIGTGIDKTAEAWDKATQEYAANIYDTAGSEGQMQVADQFSHAVRRIKSQIASGQISREEGARRARQIYQKLGLGG
jgi:hypothetical protein